MNRCVEELLIVYEDGREERHKLVEDELILGRHPGRGLALDDAYLSRTHCRVGRVSGRLAISDLDSFNGTYVNGHKIHERCFIQIGDVLRVGHCRIYVKSPERDSASLTVHAPDLAPGEGVRAVSKAKPLQMSEIYRGRVEKAARFQGARRPTRKSLRRSDADPVGPMGTMFDAAVELPDSVSGTARYRRPDLPEEESENPTPIPDEEFTASAVLRSEPTDSARERERLGLRVIAQLARVLHSIEDLEEFYYRGLARLLEVVPAERAFILRLDRRRRGLYVESVKSALPDRDDEAARRLGLSHTIVKKVIRERVSVLVDDAVLDERFCEASSIQELQLRSVLCAPLTRRDRVVGVVYLDHILHSYAFTEEDREFLVAAANIMALASRRRRG